MTNWKKYLIGAVLIAIIILLIIWYRNTQKAKAVIEAKNKLISSGVNPTEIIEIPTSSIGKTAFVKTGGAKFYNVALFDSGNYTVAYIKNNAGEFAGTIKADKTNDGSTAFYKVLNTAGNELYVLKSSITVK